MPPAGQRLVAHAEVGGAGRVDHQAAAVADVGQMAEHLQRLDEGLALFAAALEVEAEHRAGAARQQLLRQRVAGVGLQQRVADAGHEGVAGQELDHLGGVVHVPRHAQAQRLDALQHQPGRMRAQAGAEVAQAFAPGAQQEGAHGGLVGEHHVVEAVVGLGQFGELAAGRVRRAQSKLPPSTTMPAITVPWPLRNLVAEW